MNANHEPASNPVTPARAPRAWMMAVTLADGRATSAMHDNYLRGAMSEAQFTSNALAAMIDKYGSAVFADATWHVYPID